VTPAKTSTVQVRELQAPASVQQIGGGTGGGAIVNAATGQVIPGAAGINSNGFAVDSSGNIIGGGSGGNVAIRGTRAANGSIVDASGRVITSAVGVDAQGFAVNANGQRLAASGQGGGIRARYAGGGAGGSAKTATIQIRVVDTPASVRRVVIPGRSETVSRRVVATPASVRRVAVPAKTRTIQRRVLAAPATVESIGTEATYRNVTRRELVSPESLQWREILCETNASPRLVKVRAV